MDADQALQVVEFDCWNVVVAKCFSGLVRKQMLKSSCCVAKQALPRRGIGSYWFANGGDHYAARALIDG